MTIGSLKILRYQQEAKRTLNYLDEALFTDTKAGIEGLLSEQMNLKESDF